MLVLAERPRPRAVREHPMAGWMAVATVCFGAFMGQLDASIVTLTFPALQRELHQPLAVVQWVSLAYLLVLVGLVAAAGRLADAVGRKAVYLYGFAVFTVASAACALAPGLGWLVGFRVVQAGGAAMLQANSVALVVTSVPQQKMRAALGVQAAAQALGLALGPALGGLLVASVGWRWVFWVNVPVGVVALVAGRYLLPRTRQRRPLRGFDWPGLLALGAASTALLLGVSAFSGLALPGWAAAALVGASAPGFAGFAWRERTTANPLVDLSLLRPAAVSVGLLGALFAYMVLFGPLALFPQVLGGRAGLVLTALPAGFALAAVLAGRAVPRRWDERWGPRARGLAGAVTAVVASGALLLSPRDLAWVACWLLVLGLGLGVLIPANNASIMGAVPPSAAGTGGGLVNMARGLGTAFGVAAVTASLHLAPGSPTSGPRVALTVLLVCAVVVAATALAGTSAPTRRSTP